MAKSRAKWLIVLLCISCLALGAAFVFGLERQNVGSPVSIVYTAGNGSKFLTYNTNVSGGYTVTGYDPSKVNGQTEIVIPDTYKGLPVTEIGQNAFANAPFQKVTFGAKVKSIGDSAFENCALQGTFEIPSSITEIGNRAFSGCQNLGGDLDINVTTIGNLAFSGCGFKNVHIGKDVSTIGYAPFAFSNIETITVHPKNVSFTSIIYDDDFAPQETNTLICYYDEYLGSSIIQGSQNSTFFALYEKYRDNGYNSYSGLAVGDYAFAGVHFNNHEMENINVEYIGEHAFDSCTGLNQVSLNDCYYELLGEAAFENSDVKKITLMTSGGTYYSGCLSIGDRAFNGCVELAEVCFKSNIIGSDVSGSDMEGMWYQITDNVYYDDIFANAGANTSGLKFIIDAWVGDFNAEIFKCRDLKTCYLTGLGWTANEEGGSDFSGFGYIDDTGEWHSEKYNALFNVKDLIIADEFWSGGAANFMWQLDSLGINVDSGLRLVVNFPDVTVESMIFWNDWSSADSEENDIRRRITELAFGPEVTHIGTNAIYFDETDGFTALHGLTFMEPNGECTLDENWCGDSNNGYFYGKEFVLTIDNQNIFDVQWSQFAEDLAYIGLDNSTDPLLLRLSEDVLINASEDSIGNSYWNWILFEVSDYITVEEIDGKTYRVADVYNTVGTLG